MVPRPEKNRRSYRCTVDLLLYLREQRGWSQSELAKIAGYSERLISKAESGRPISKESVKILALTLSTPEEPISFEDLISDHVAIAKLYTETMYRYRADTFKVLGPYFAENIIFRVAGNPALIPFAGEHRGLAAVERAFAIFFSILEAPDDYDYESRHTYITQGRDVIVWGDSGFHPIGMPFQTPVKTTIRMRFENGKIALFEDLFDTQLGERLLAESKRIANHSDKPES